VAAEPRRGRHPFLARRFEDEAGYRRRVEVADRLGIPPSQLEGREPAEETRHHYDRRGRLIRSVTIREPRYTEQDRAELIALALYREGLCPKCGRPQRVCTSHEEQGPEFSASYKVCRATYARIEQWNALTDGGKKSRPFADSYLWMTTTTDRR
jgi:hypothetical protein